MKKLLGISIPTFSKSDTLEHIEKYLSFRSQFCHIVSLNPENFIISLENDIFREAIETSQIKIIDGVGIILAAQILNIPIGTRMTGIELMERLIVIARKGSLTTLFIGGRPNLALDLAKCYQRQFPEAKFFGIEGFKNIQKQTKNEEDAIISIVRTIKPNLIFAAFGSPWQELWLARHKRQLKGIVCMGVGQGFDVAAGVVERAPVWIQQTGMEWLYSLIIQPWRWRRQLRLIKFMWLVLKQKFSSDNE